MTPILKTVFIIDDDTFNVILIERLFRKNKYAEEVFTFHNGAEALEKIIDLEKANMAQPDMILLDINMPIMDGFEFLKALKSQYPQLVSFKIFVMLTTVLREQMVYDEVAELITGFIDKPLRDEMVKNLLLEHFSYQI